MYVKDKTNVNIRNVEINMSCVETSNYGIYIGESTLLKLSNNSINITEGNLINMGLYNFRSSPHIDNIKINVTCGSSNGNYGIYNNICQKPIINNSQIDVLGSAEFNIGVKNINSSPQYRNTIINANSGIGDGIGIGIDNEATDYMTSISNGLISFEHYDDKRDIIRLSGGGFLESGFLKDFMIKVFGSNESQNNQTFIISYLTDDTLTLAENQNLVNSDFGESITIIQYYTFIF